MDIFEVRVYADLFTAPVGVRITERCSYFAPGEPCMTRWRRVGLYEPRQHPKTPASIKQRKTTLGTLVASLSTHVL